MQGYERPRTRRTRLYTSLYVILPLHEARSDVQDPIFIWTGRYGLSLPNKQAGDEFNVL